MEPAIDHAIAQVNAGTFKAEDYREWTMMKAGGASLSPFYEFDDKIPAETKARIEALTAQIKAGELVVPVNDAEPKSRSEEHTSELQSLMRISSGDLCLKKKRKH